MSSRVPGREKKGRYISDKLKTWHIVLLVIIGIGLFGAQWWLNGQTTVEKYPERAQQVE